MLYKVGWSDRSVSVVHGKLSSGIVVILLLCLFSPVLAGDNEKIIKSSNDTDGARHHRYVVEGDSLTGRLFETEIFQGRSGHRTTHSVEESPVFFKQGGLYLNPFSVPTAIVWVQTQANFQIGLMTGDNAVLDTLEFVEVENGVYLFPLPDRLPPPGIVGAILYFGGVEVDRITIPFR
jgi:hypothetical protein